MALGCNVLWQWLRRIFFFRSLSNLFRYPMNVIFVFCNLVHGKHISLQLWRDYSFFWTKDGLLSAFYSSSLVNSMAVILYWVFLCICVIFLCCVFPSICVTRQKSQGNWGVRKRQIGKNLAGYVLCVIQSDSAKDWGSPMLSLEWEYYALSLSHAAVKGRQQERACW